VVVRAIEPEPPSVGIAHTAIIAAAPAHEAKAVWTIRTE
jgi:hypothetical protein